MYLRRVQRKNKDGSVVTYLQIAHNERDPVTGQPRARVHYSFSRADEHNIEQLRSLVRSISRFLSPEDVLQAQAALKGQGGLRFIESRPLGGAWVLDALWKQIGIHRLLETLAQKRAFRTPVERAIFAMVANRALAPDSKRKVETWVREQVAIPGLEEIPLQQLYRAMDFLLEVHRDLWKTGNCDQQAVSQRGKIMCLHGCERHRRRGAIGSALTRPRFHRLL